MNEEQLSTLAHELKTPVAVILGYAELIGLRSDNETRLAASEQIAAAARRLTRTIDDLLDLSVDEETGTRSSHDVRQLDRVAPRVQHARVVVVDDDPFVRQLLRLTLSPDSFEIAEASDGDVAVTLIESQAAELVILDWQMQRVSGAQALEAMRRQLPNLPVIVLTAAADQREHARSLGASAFLTKPFSPLELISTVERLLADRAPDQAA